MRRPSPGSALGVPALLFCLALLGCGEVREGGRVVVGALPFVSSAPVFLALDDGYFEDAGLEVEIRLFRAAQPVAVAVASGDVDFGVTGLTAGFYNLAQGAGLRLLAAQARVEPGSPFIAVCASPAAWDGGLRTIADLRSRRVGITQEGSTFHYMIGRLAESRGYAVEDIDLVPLEAVPNLIAALRGGGVDAVLLPAHLALPLARESEAHVIGWVGEDLSWQLGALFASQATLDRRPEASAAFVAAYRRGAALYAQTLLARDVEGRRVIGPDARAMAARLQAWVPSSVEAILEGAPSIPADAALSMESVAEQVRWFQARGLVVAELEPDRLFVDAVAGTGSRR